MALKKCKECKKEVSSKAKACPHCGAPVKTEVSTGMGFLIFVIAIFVYVGIFSESGDGDYSSAKSDVDWRTKDNSSMAYIMIEGFVKNKLKSPSSAKFPGVWDGKLEHVKQMGDQAYKINSYVDAQNSFGADMRIRFVGVIKQVSDEEWQLQSLELLE